MYAGTLQLFSYIATQIIRRTSECFSRYTADTEFELKARMIPALAFVPPLQVVRCFEELEAIIQEPALEPLLDWLEDTYIGRLIGGGPDRRQPRYRMHTDS